MERVSWALWSVMRIPMFFDLSCITIFLISSMAMGSMPAKGSSSRMNLGLAARERAISVRRRSPPERLMPLVLRTCSMPNSASNSSKRSLRRAGSFSENSKMDIMLFSTDICLKMEASCAK